jgi:hypothetical protein
LASHSGKITHTHTRARARTRFWAHRDTSQYKAS